MNGVPLGGSHPARRFSNWWTAIFPVVFLSSLSGCLVYDVASVPVKIATKTVQVAGMTTVAIVETGGKVAVSAVRATGAVTSGGIDSSARLARAGMVTFSDQATGLVVRVPWARGLTLFDASNAAKMDVGRRAIRIFREGKQASAGTSRARGDLLLHAGDVVTLEG